MEDTERNKLEQEISALKAEVEKAVALRISDATMLAARDETIEKLTLAALTGGKEITALRKVAEAARELKEWVAEGSLCESDKPYLNLVAALDEVKK